MKRIGFLLVLVTFIGCVNLNSRTKTIDDYTKQIDSVLNRYKKQFILIEMTRISTHYTPENKISAVSLQFTLTPMEKGIKNTVFSYRYAQIGEAMPNYSNNEIYHFEPLVGRSTISYEIEDLSDMQAFGGLTAKEFLEKNQFVIDIKYLDINDDILSVSYSIPFSVRKYLEQEQRIFAQGEQIRSFRNYKHLYEADIIEECIDSLYDRLNDPVFRRLVKRASDLQ